ENDVFNLPVSCFIRTDSFDDSCIYSSEAEFCMVVLAIAYRIEFINKKDYAGKTGSVLSA
ncbi:MAG: hypothetical protein ACI32N_05375, partial [Bulleidia sp.]